MKFLSAAAVMLFAARAHAGAVTFAHDVAPIVYQYCAPCHHAGLSAPFSLLNYEDVRKHSREIAGAVSHRVMPPWPLQPGYGDFSDSLRLSDAQIQTIAEWVREGTPEGPSAEAPAPPQYVDGWQLGTPDLILEAQQPFTVPATGPDVYWNFIFPTDLKTVRYVRAVEIRPGERGMVHHANLYVDWTRSARTQEKSPGAGFPGMDPVIERTAFEPDDGHLLFWKPGSLPYVEPDGLAWSLRPGSDLVLNAHLKTRGHPEPVRPSIGLYFTDKPPNRFPMLVQLEHDGALNIPPGNRDFVVSDDFRLPLDADILAVYPHAHYLGHLLEGYATLPGGERKWLIRIPDWNPAWQGVYHYREPVFLPKGTVISMRYHYDNSAANPRNPNKPPKRVMAGNQSTDEMGHLWLQVLPRGNGDHRLQLEEALMQHRLEKYPGDFTAHLHLGAVMLTRLNTSGAVSMLQAAARAQPDHPEAHNLLGSALVASGRNSEAIDQFRLALKLRPDYENARLNLGRALIRAGKLNEGLGNCRQVIAVYPDDPQAKDCVDRATFKMGAKRSP